MDTSLQSIFGFYMFTTGRRLFAMSEVQKTALAANEMEIATAAMACLSHDEGVQRTEAAWVRQSKKDAMFSPEAKAIDVAIDQVLASIRDTAQAQVDACARDDALGREGAAFLEELFPAGLGAVTQLPFIEELAEVDRVLDLLAQPGRAQLIVDLGLSRYVARLSSLAKEYRGALATPAERLQFVDLQAARAEGQRLMLEVVAKIVGRFPSDKPSDVAQRASLLGPIAAQNDAIGAALRAKRPVADVDPKTGISADANETVV